MQKFLIYLVVLFFVSLAAAQSPPPFPPLDVEGTVEIDGEPAPVGTLVTAEMDGETVDYELTEPGEYTLSVPGTTGDYWKEVKFYVDGILMEQTAQWKAGGLVTIDFNISEDSTTTSTTLPSDESTTTSSSTSTTVSDVSTTVSSTSSSTTLSSTTSSTSSTSTIPPVTTTAETTTSTVMAASSTVATTIKPEAASGDGFSPKLFLLAILGIMLLLLLATLMVMMKRK